MSTLATNASVLRCRVTHVGGCQERKSVLGVVICSSGSIPHAMKLM
jgi:hypothetical protein